MLHQTVIGQEAKLQMELAGEEPEVVIGCFGGGSNFGGLALPYVLDRLAGKGPRILAVEPSACPSLTKGTFAYDYGDTAKLTPLIKMYTLGHDFVPPGIHAGGLRYHGASPLLSHLLTLRLDRGQGVLRRFRSSKRRCSSRAPKAFCRRRNRRTPSAPRWMRRSPRAKKDARALSCSV